MSARACVRVRHIERCVSYAGRLAATHAHSPAHSPHTVRAHTHSPTLTHHYQHLYAHEQILKLIAHLRRLCTDVNVNARVCAFVRVCARMCLLVQLTLSCAVAVTRLDVTRAAGEREGREGEKEGRKGSKFFNQ